MTQKKYKASTKKAVKSPKEATPQPVIQKSLKKDLSLALQQWESISRQVAQEISPDQKQLNEFRELLQDVSRKIKTFEG
jgi:hypothetical protein